MQQQRQRYVALVCEIPGKWCRQRQGSPRRDHLRGLLGSSRLVTSANPTILALAISPPDHEQYVAAVRHQRDLIPPESGGQTSSRLRQSARRRRSTPDGTATGFPLYPRWRTSTITGPMSVSCQHRKWVSFDHRPLVQAGSTQSQCRAPGASSTG